MRHTATILLIIFSSTGFAQSKTVAPSPTDFDSKQAISSFSQIYLGKSDLETKVKNHLTNTIENLRNDKISLELDTAIESLAGWHFTYHQNYDGIEIFNSQIKVNTNKNGTITSVFDYSFNSSLIEKNDFPSDLKLLSQLSNNQIFKSSKLIYLFNGGRLIPAAAATYIEDDEFPFEIAIDINSNIVYRKDLNLLGKV